MSINHCYSSELPEGQCQWWSPPYMMESPPPKTSSSSPLQFHNSHSHLIPTTATTAAAVYWPNPNLYHHPTTAPSAMFCPQNTAFSFNLNNDDADEELIDENNNSTTSSGKEVQPPLRQVQDEDKIPKEPLFEKPLTPSDVGKLNRLVIPKQHAEKYFPLNGGGGGGEKSGEKGLLLGFEDELGKSWRFRYSYWNSSQSYVLTKGWSRFVKEKRLDAGDVVVFTRHRLDSGRFFIGWRRRNSPSYGGGTNSNISSGGNGWGRAVAAAAAATHHHQNYQTGRQYSTSPQPPYPSECLNAGTAAMTSGNNNKNSNNNSKRLRLFGVNLDFPADGSEPSTPDDPPMSQSHPYIRQYYSSHHNYMDINFSGGGDVYRQG